MPAKPKNELVQFKQKQAEAFAAVKTSFAKKLADLVDYMAGLDASEIHDIISDKAMTKYLNALGLNSGAVKAVKARSAKVVKRGKATRGKLVEGVTGHFLKKIKDTDITAFIGTVEKVQADLNKKYGQLIPKRLADMKRAGLVTVTKDGIKKLWKVA